METIESIAWLIDLKKRSIPNKEGREEKGSKKRVEPTPYILIIIPNGKTGKKDPLHDFAKEIGMSGPSEKASRAESVAIRKRDFGKIRAFTEEFVFTRLEMPLLLIRCVFSNQ